MDKATMIAFGGKELSVFHEDGTQETVKVKLLKITEIQEYFNRAEDETALASYICGKDEPWARTLTLESTMDICEAAHELNFQNARRWAQRRAQQNEALLPLAESGKRIQQALGNSALNAPASSLKRHPRLPEV
jgi:hypothetical protein